MAVRRMPRRKDRAHFRRDAMRGKTNIAAGVGLKRGGYRTV